MLDGKGVDATFLHRLLKVLPLGNVAHIPDGTPCMRRRDTHHKL